MMLNTPGAFKRHRVAVAFHDARSPAMALAARRRAV
jgi:hypothetical protein